MDYKSVIAGMLGVPGIQPRPDEPRRNDMASQVYSLLGEHTPPVPDTTPPMFRMASQAMQAAQSKSSKPSDPALAQLQQANDTLQKVEAAQAISTFRQQIQGMADDDAELLGAELEDMFISPQKNKAFAELASRSYNPYIRSALALISDQLRGEQAAKQQFQQNLRLIKKEELRTKREEDKANKAKYYQASLEIQKQMNAPGGVTADWGQRYLDELTRQYQSGADLDFSSAYKTASTVETWENVDPATEGQIPADNIGVGKDYELVNPDGSRNADGYKYKRRTVTYLKPSDYMIPAPSKAIGTPQAIQGPNGELIYGVNVMLPDGTIQFQQTDLGPGYRKAPSNIEHKSNESGTDSSNKKKKKNLKDRFGLGDEG